MPTYESEEARSILDTIISQIYHLQSIDLEPVALEMNMTSYMYLERYMCINFPDCINTEDDPNNVIIKYYQIMDCNLRIILTKESTYRVNVLGKIKNYIQ